MADFQFYSPEDIIYANLQNTTREIDMLCEQERAHLRELAREITKDLTDHSDIALSLSDLLPERFDVPVHALPQNEEFLKSLHPFHDIRQTVLLCMEICNQLAQKNDFGLRDFFPETEESSEPSPNRIIYPRSTYADTAYLRFAPLISDSRAVYAHSFPMACEEVYNGLCKYCILPLENSADGQLNSLARLIDRYELKIACTCDVTATDGSRTTRFALLRREILPVISQGTSLYFEFAAPLQESLSGASLLFAAELCGLSLERMDSRPQAADSATPQFTRFVCRIERGNLPAFLLFLFSRAHFAVPIGIYPHLK